MHKKTAEIHKNTLAVFLMKINPCFIANDFQNNEKIANGKPLIILYHNTPKKSTVYRRLFYTKNAIIIYVIFT